MKLRFVWVGKTRSAALRELVGEYFKRLGRFAQLEVTEVKDASSPGFNTGAVVETEGERILAATKSDPFVILLDETGRELSSTGLAALLDEHMGRGTKQLTFVIGGHAGSSGAVKKRADMVLALSKMTFTHEIARALVAEQVYRAFTIINNFPYQK
ncbi:MAG TPA: 23S rRNA (pseudouridine(1915)-N(3))-methyltransferase RlmH [Blastocatellia bacterium]|nr:23S rRNA (pseudouridine(1915)-N(3))-methyltransferase RlmH [Blastocatellia bacterium]